MLKATKKDIKKPYVVKQIEKWLQSADVSRKRPFKVCVVARTRSKLWEILDTQKDIVFKMAKEKRCGYAGFYYFKSKKEARKLQRKLYNEKVLYAFVQDDEDILKEYGQKG
jgi:predicted nucleic-acid-binding Zn-ribbon protein